MNNTVLWANKRIDEIRQEVFHYINEGLKPETALNIVLAESCLSVTIKQGIRKEFL